MSALGEFAAIAWPGLLVLAAMCGFVGWAIHDHRRRHPRGHYRIRFEGPRGVLTAEHDLTLEQARQVAALAHELVGTDLPDPGESEREATR